LQTLQAQVAASGNVPAPISTQIGSVLRASGAGSFAWFGGTSDVASASTVDLAATTSRRVVITGTTTITSFGTPATSGDWRWLRFTGALTLTHNTTTLHLPGQANITTAAEDRALFVSRGGSGWECYAYVRASGKPIVPSLPTELGSMSAGRLLGRLPGSGSGSPQELTLGATGAALIDDETTAAARSTIGVNLTIPDIILQHQATSGTAGGSAGAATWNTAPLTTEVRDNDNICTLTANQFSLPAGTYYIEAESQAYRVDGHKTRLRNITDAASTLIGTNAHANGTNGCTSSTMSGSFTIAGTKTFELQHYTVTARATDGLGLNLTTGETEIYRTVRIWKTA
jgi:hypothetical protein